MADIDTLKTLLNLPKEIIDKGETFLKVLFGGAVKETGEMISDQIRYYRFRNQLKIFSKASDLLDKKDIPIKQVGLKNLVPLIELSSLEDDDEMQLKWANVIANLASYNSEEIFNKNCIELLHKLSPTEIKLLDDLYNKFLVERGEVVELRQRTLILKDNVDIFSGEVLFDPFELSSQMSIELYRIKLYIENLVSLGLLQFEELDLDDGRLITSNNVYLTYLGLYFVRLCKYK